MGQGEETAKKTVKILERGEIFFFYRPKVEKEEVRGPEDVQRFYLVLRTEQGQGEGEETQEGRPEQGEGEEKQGGVSLLLRLMLMGRKALPNPIPSKKSSPYWGLVELATADVQHVKAALKGREYDTATRGHRHLPPCRAVGEGVYMILNHDTSRARARTRTHTHLVYKLQYPREGVEGEPQEAFNIAREASFLIQIKNPQQPPTINNNNKAALFPAHLQGLFGNRRYHPADPPDFLNHEGCEFLLISASDHVEEELGLEINAEEHDQCPDLIQTFGRDDTVVSFRPLFQGTWD